MWYPYLAQAAGIVGLLFVVMSFQYKTQQGILINQLIGSLFFTVHFFMLGAYTGAVMNLLVGVRNMTFYQLKKHDRPMRIWMYVFCVMYVVAGALTWQGYYSLFPILGMLFGTVAYCAAAPRLTRLLLIPTCPLWATHNLITGAYAALVTDTISLVSLVIGIIRHDVLHREEKAAETAPDVPAQSESGS